MSGNDLSDSGQLAISYLNALEYCPRRFYYECVLSEFVENVHTIEGTLRHARSDAGQTTTEDGVIIHRGSWLWSDRLHLSGFADVIEEEAGQLYPVEYKKGKQGEWLNNHVQLCAQALCLEEMRACSISHGYIFYAGSGRREEVIFTPELRQYAESTIVLAFQLIENGQLPAPLSGKPGRRSSLPVMHPKCKDCSLEPLCLPREVLALTQQTL